MKKQLFLLLALCAGTWGLNAQVDTMIHVLNVSPEACSLKPGESVKPSVSWEPANLQPYLRWQVSTNYTKFGDPAVHLFNGELFAIAPGQATVSVYADAQSAKCDITVTGDKEFNPFIRSSELTTSPAESSMPATARLSDGKMTLSGTIVMPEKADLHWNCRVYEASAFVTIDGSASLNPGGMSPRLFEISVPDCPMEKMDVFLNVSIAITDTLQEVPVAPIVSSSRIASAPMSLSSVSSEPLRIAVTGGRISSSRPVREIAVYDLTGTLVFKTGRLDDSGCECALKPSLYVVKGVDAENKGFHFLIGV